MNSSNLSFTRLPPIDVPFRYFITAPLFVVAIAIWMLFTREPLWVSRWQYETLAITHTFTLGFMASIMMGALYQLLPVTSGLSINKPRLTASFCHMFHTIGTILLILGFLLTDHNIQLSAAICLAIGFSLYFVSFGYLLLKDSFNNKQKHRTNFTLKGIKIALTALFLTVILGEILQTKVLGLTIIPWDKNFTNLHAIWGLSGWTTILIMTISFQVIPMFHVAPEFPSWLKRYLPISSILCLLTLSLAKFIPPLNHFQNNIHYLLLVINIIFITYLLNVINKRKRKVSDTSINYWRLAAFAFFIIFILCLMPDELLPQLIIRKYSMLLAALFIFGFVTSILQAMLIKILPFLVFTHLQQHCMINLSAMQALPNMHEILIKQHGHILFVLHCLTLVVLLLSIMLPVYYWILPLLLILEFSWLTFLIIKAASFYKHFNKKILSLINAK